MLYRQFYQSPVGKLSLLASKQGLLGVYFIGQQYFERGNESVEIAEQTTSILETTKEWLSQYFSGMNPSLSDLILAPSGSDFQHKVWTALLEIPYGQTITYGDLADKLGCKSAQAIGGAVGKNPLSIIIPCHRVLGSDGSLTGYAGGLEKKKWLLDLEKAQLEN